MSKTCLKYIEVILDYSYYLELCEAANTVCQNVPNTQASGVTFSSLKSCTAYRLIMWAKTEAGPGPNSTRTNNTQVKSK